MSSMARYQDILRKRAKKSQSTKVLGKYSPYEIIGKPVITEKAYKQVEDMNTYTFRVQKDANKNDVKQSLFAIYKVTPVSVRLINVPYKGRNNRSLVRRAFKKAIVTLKDGQKIELAG